MNIEKERGARILFLATECARHRRRVPLDSWWLLAETERERYREEWDIACAELGAEKNARTEDSKGNRPLPKGRGFPKLNDVEHAVLPSVSYFAGSPRAAIPQQAGTRDSQAHQSVASRPSQH